MADNTNTQATQGQAQDNGSAGGNTTPAKLYQTKAEAEANKPADATKNHRVFEVAKSGTTAGFIWARGYDNALALVARLDGYSASLGNSPAVTKEAVAAKLATFTDDELAAMGLSRKPVGKGKK
jgi:hypothetical protein